MQINLRCRYASIVFILSCSTGTLHSKIVFKDDIFPIVEKHCLKCHQAPQELNGKIQKPKGDLRLDAAWAILHGSKGGPVIKSGNSAGSRLLEVVTLPQDDDDFMPPSGKADPLNAEQIAKLKTWIDEGADFGGWEGSVAGKPAAPVAPQVQAPKIRDHDELYKKLGDGVTPLDAGIIKNVKTSGAQISPLTAGSPLLRVDFLTGVSRCTDASIASLAPLKSHIAHLDLGRAAITDAALKEISEMPKLTRLDLRKTRITDQNLSALVNVKNLTYLNLYGTEVTDAGLEQIAKISTLQDVYLFETKVTEAGVAKLKTALPKADVVWNLALTPRAEGGPAMGGKKRKKQ